MIWFGSYWVNNNGVNFVVNLILLNSIGGKVSLVLGCFLLKYFNFKYVYFLYFNFKYVYFF